MVVLHQQGLMQMKQNSLLIEGYATQKKAKEIWKPIPGYEGLYDASSLGRIRSAPGKTTSSAKFEKRVWKSRIMKFKCAKCPKGRDDYRISLWKDGKSRDYLVSRLIAFTWHGIPDGKMTVNHINGDYHDNRPENLEWVSLSDNVKLGFENGQFDSFMKKVTLIGEDGERLDFRSQSQASLYLGHAVGYVCERLKRNASVMYSTNGKRYLCVLKEVS